MRWFERLFPWRRQRSERLTPEEKVEREKKEAERLSGMPFEDAEREVDLTKYTDVPTARGYQAGLFLKRRRHSKGRSLQ